MADKEPKERTELNIDALRDDPEDTETMPTGSAGQKPPQQVPLLLTTQVPQAKKATAEKSGTQPKDSGSAKKSQTQQKESGSATKAKKPKEKVVATKTTNAEGANSSKDNVRYAFSAAPNASRGLAINTSQEVEITGTRASNSEANKDKENVR